VQAESAESEDLNFLAIIPGVGGTSVENIDVVEGVNDHDEGILAHIVNLGRQNHFCRWHWR
jgi:hypothetical protein